MAPSYFSVALLLITATISMAAFHPAAASAVTRASGRDGEQVARGMRLVESWHVPLAQYISLRSWMGRARRKRNRRHSRTNHSPLFCIGSYVKAPSLAGSSSVSAIWESMKEQRRPLLLLSGLVLFRSIAITSFTTFFPTYLVDQGSDLFYAGLALGLRTSRSGWRTCGRNAIR